MCMGKFQVLFALSIIAVVSAGCESSAELAARAAARAADDDSMCQSYGLKFGTPEYAQCRQNIEGRRSAERRAAFGAYMASRGQSAPAPQPYMIPTNRSINTNCTTIGTQTSCQSQ